MLFEVWIMDCYLAHVTEELEYTCQAAIWAQDQDNAMRLLANYFEPHGYRILWVDECYPAKAYSNEIKLETSEVHAENPIVLGPMVAKNGQAVLEDYVVIEEIKNAQPLDNQFGVWPLQTVPDALYEPLFGQPKLTEIEISQYRDEKTASPMMTYAILDAAKITNLVPNLEISGLEHRCLFKGDAYEDYKDVAPWVVQLEEDSEFTRRLFTQGKEPWYLWDKEPGIYIRSRASLHEVWQYFRKFTKLQDENGKWFYFRFWEAENITIIEQVSNDPESPFISIWNNALIASVLVISSVGIKLITPIYRIPAQKKPIRMKQTDFNAIRKTRQHRFINKVSKALIQEHPKLYPDQDLSVIKPLYLSAQKKGYTIELASYNYIRSGLLAQKIGLNIENIEQTIDPHCSVSPLARSELIWEHLKKLGRIKK